MPKMKTKKSAAKRFMVRPSGTVQARSGLQAPHSDQEDHQEQTPSARLDGGSRFRSELGARNDAVTPNP